MRLAVVQHAGTRRVVVVRDEHVFDVTPEGDDEVVDLIPMLATILDRPDELAARADAAPPIPLTEVQLLAPIARPPEFLAIGLNYADHIAETGRTAPEFPMFFNKQSSCVTGPGGEIHLPRASQFIDYEGELGVVIGRRCRHVPVERAHEVVAGYLIVNDVTARDWQSRSPTMTLGKSFDTHGPIGPWLVTTSEVPDPHLLGIRTFVNGEMLQDGSTADMIHSCWEQIATLSTVCTLEPGTVIATGTPAGVGIARSPQRPLLAGDHVAVEIENIGRLENSVVIEPDDTAHIG